MSNIHPFNSRELIRREAREWVLKFNQDTPPSESDVAALKQWVARSPEHKLQLQQAEANWCDADLLALLKVTANRRKSARRRVLTVSGLAAVASILFGFFVNPMAVLNLADENRNYYQTEIGQIETIALSDGTIVQLDTNSAISIRYTDQVRHIDMVRGKAYFDVEKNMNRPFEVYTSFGKVKAVGTAFTVYLGDNDITVTVEEGRVELSQNLSGNSISTPKNSMELSNNPTQPPSRFLSLGQGEQAVYAQTTKEKQKIQSGDLARDLAWRRGVLIFAGEPLEQVVNEISRYTPIQITIVNPELRQLEVGGRFATGELEALLDVLEVGFGVQVSHVEPKLIELR